MKEMGIASSLLDTVRGRAARNPGARPLRVGLRVGEGTGVDVESLRSCIESLATDSELQGLRLEIDYRRRRNRCRRCGWEFRVKNDEIRCPYCGDETTSAFEGAELDVAYIELE